MTSSAAPRKPEQASFLVQWAPRGAWDVALLARAQVVLPRLVRISHPARLPWLPACPVGGRGDGPVSKGRHLPELLPLIHIGFLPAARLRFPGERSAQTSQLEAAEPAPQDPGSAWGRPGL